MEDALLLEQLVDQEGPICSAEDAPTAPITGSLAQLRQAISLYSNAVACLGHRWRCQPSRNRKL